MWATRSVDLYGVRFGQFDGELFPSCLRVQSTKVGIPWRIGCSYWIWVLRQIWEVFRSSKFVAWLDRLWGWPWKQFTVTPRAEVWLRVASPRLLIWGAKRIAGMFSKELNCFNCRIFDIRISMNWIAICFWMDGTLGNLLVRWDEMGTSRNEMPNGRSCKTLKCTTLADGFLDACLLFLFGLSWEEDRFYLAITEFSVMIFCARLAHTFTHVHPNLYQLVQYTELISSHVGRWALSQPLAELTFRIIPFSAAIGSCILNLH